jgi:hypothetical protein
MSNTKNCFNAHKVRVRAGLHLPEKVIILLVFLLCFLFVLYSCSPSKEEMEFRETSAEIDKSLIGYTAPLATDTIDGITRHFVRTAELKCRVNDVLSTSESIQDLVKKHGGYISGSNFESHITQHNSIRFKKDSVVNLNYYVSTNSLTLKVPNKQLDTILNKISKSSVFIDYRRLSADDVKMALFANQLSEQRYTKYKNNTNRKINTTRDKLEQFVKAEENLLEKQSLIDGARLSSYELAEKVNYSTISIELYQAPQLELTVLPCDPTIIPYTIPFLERLKDSCLTGVQLFESCILFLVKLFGFIFFALLLFFLYKKIKPLVLKTLGIPK